MAGESAESLYRTSSSSSTPVRSAVAARREIVITAITEMATQTSSNALDPPISLIPDKSNTDINAGRTNEFDALDDR